MISNGLHRFPLARAAAEVAKSDQLVLLLTGGYASSRLTRGMRVIRMDRHPRFRRLRDRSEAVAESQIKSLWIAEGLSQVATAARNRGALRVSDRFDNMAMRQFARSANRELIRRAISCDVYHYRSGFGLESVATLKARGAVALCDHSAVHPLSLEGLLDEPRLSLMWRTVLRDLDLADYVVVNSSFVKDTFVAHGWDANRVHVVYQGIDNEFLNCVRPRPAAPPDRSEFRMLFAGWFDRKKGAGDLETALLMLDDVPWRLDVAGPISFDAKQRHARLLNDDRVTIIGNLPRRVELIESMAKADVFVLPSLAEGSARAIWDALAAGLFVITTPTSGSIVVDGVHGSVVPARDPTALARAIRCAADDRRRVHEIGRANASLVRKDYTQSTYGETLRNLYDQLLPKMG